MSVADFCTKPKRWHILQFLFATFLFVSIVSGSPELVVLIVHLYVCTVFCAPHPQVYASFVCINALLGMQPLQSMPNTTQLCVSTLDTGSCW